MGEVQEVGSEVTKHQIGDRVGVGCMVNSCRDCENCRAGMEQYCLTGNTGTFTSIDRDGTITQGGYSTQIVVDEDFVLRGPDTIAYEAAAPLLCAGSGIGSIGETEEMLDFCAVHGIAPETELISADLINDAYERVLLSEVRYRFVIDTATL